MKRLRDWVKDKTAPARVWTAKKWTQFKAWFYGLLVAVGLAAGGSIALADDITLSWNNATQWNDGSVLAPEDLQETILEYQFFPLGTDITTEPRVYAELVRVPATVESYVHSNQPNGIHCYVGYHTAQNSEGNIVRSVMSDEACKTVDVRLPVTLSGLTAN